MLSNNSNQPQASKTSDPKAAEAPAPEAKMPGLAPTTTPPAAAMPKVAADEREPAEPAATGPKKRIRSFKRDTGRQVTVELRRQADNLRLFFPFSTPTAAVGTLRSAYFLRANS